MERESTQRFLVRESCRRTYFIKVTYPCALLAGTIFLQGRSHRPHVMPSRLQGRMIEGGNTTKTRKVGRENPNVVLYYQIFVNHTHETKSKYREESVIIPYEIGQNINTVT